MKRTDGADGDTHKDNEEATDGRASPSARGAQEISTRDAREMGHPSTRLRTQKKGSRLAQVAR